MSKWIVKSAIQRVISWLPQSHKVNALFQQYVTKGLHVRPASFEGKLADCRTHLEHFRNFGSHSRGSFRVLELGTGWWPIIPVGLYLCGADEITTYDIAPLLRQDTFSRILKLYVEYHQDGRLARLLPDARPERLAMLPELYAKALVESPEAVLKSLRIFPIVGDARHTDLPAGSIDLVYSNFCLEHIGRQVQADLHREFRRVSSKESVLSHYIGIGDQYANFDPSISMFNFMKFSNRQWRFLDNAVIPQTRLRPSDYRSIFEGAGFKVIKQQNVNGSKDDLAKIVLAPEFRHYSEEDLLVIYSWLVSKPN